MEAEELLKQYAAGVRDFIAINVSEANLSGVNLSNANLSYAVLSVANLSGANLGSANLTQAKLNVARLSGANLNNAILNGADLNVANLIRADLSGAELIEAALIRAELMRADLSGADLSGANLIGAVIREAKLRQANLSGANLSEADLSGTSMIAVNLEQANLKGTDLSRCDLSGANLRDAELRQTNLTLANLSGADLSGANLRWADLSGVNLRWADLSEAKLSGANLVGADLSNANLMNASLVHANLTQANFIHADWVGADLTGAILTGAKLHAVSRFGLKTEGMTCEWVDLSPTGDRSQIYRFTSENSKKFFNAILPTVRIVIDAPLDLNANCALAAIYQQIIQTYPISSYPPSIEVSHRRTIITFRLSSDEQLFSAAYLAILPFQDAVDTQENLTTLVKQIQVSEFDESITRYPKLIEQVSNALKKSISNVSELKNTKIYDKMAKRGKFFQAPTQTILTNSSNQALSIHRHPSFGKHFPNSSMGISAGTLPAIKTSKFKLTNMRIVVDFLKGFNQEIDDI